MGIIWTLTGLSVFTKIVSSVIASTVLALFIIEIRELPKFRDHFQFLLLIAIYSGFWILYFQMFDSVLWYVKDFVDASSLNRMVNAYLMPLINYAGIGFVMGKNACILFLDQLFHWQIPVSGFKWFVWHFDVEHVTVINAGTIILLQLIISSIVKKTKALPTMMTGIAMGTIGMAILAINTSIWVFMAGIVIFSIGEMTAHPKFISYVGQTAPKERLATYMGYIFLYGVIGSSIGAPLGAKLYVHFVDNLGQPRILWIIFSGIGVVTLAGLAIFNRWTQTKSLSKAKQ
ncbi:MFS transporter [bacterium]|nr:MFS transporter [bacterium]